MKINELAQNSGPVVYYNSSFRILLEDHMTYLKTLSSTQYVEVNNHRAFKYVGDLHGLLTDLNIKPELFYIIMRMNDLSSPLDYNSDMKFLLIPDEQTINQIRTSFKIKNKT